MRSFSLLAAALWGSAVSAMPASDSFETTLVARKPAALPKSFKWTSTGPLIGPKDDERKIASIKDPSVVEIDGTYHVFASTGKAEGYNMVYLNFTDFAQADSAPFFYL